MYVQDRIAADRVQVAWDRAGDIKQEQNSGCSEAEGDPAVLGRPLTCHDSHIAVAIAECLHQRGDIGQEAQGRFLAEAGSYFLSLSQMQVLNFTGQTHQLWEERGRHEISAPGHFTHISFQSILRAEIPPHPWHYISRVVEGTFSW